MYTLSSSKCRPNVRNIFHAHYFESIKYTSRSLRTHVRRVSIMSYAFITVILMLNFVQLLSTKMKSDCYIRNFAGKRHTSRFLCTHVRRPSIMPYAFITVKWMLTSLFTLSSLPILTWELANTKWCCTLSNFLRHKWKVTATLGILHKIQNKTHFPLIADPFKTCINQVFTDSTVLPDF